ncbi:MAG: hypothetical protein KAR01_13195 [Desulfocapsa sp.]|nr:hypothetical protein [Desulfocapsa sp.]
MSPQKLQDLLDLAWNSFYQDEPQEMKMFKLFKQVVSKEMEDGTFKPRNRDMADQAFGKDLT